MFGEQTFPRTARGPRLSLLLPLALLGVGCGPGQEPSSLECGEGTEDRNGTCVAIVDPISSCGAGTLFDEATGKCETTVRCGEGSAPNEDGECVAVEECGPGTELDLATGECIPVASCGPGTVPDEATGECVSEVTCGAGTELGEDGCVAVGTCAPGTVVDVESGLCVADLACGPGQIVADGQCVAPNVAVGLEADTLESTPENNDPANGGTPEPLTLEPIGEKAVFVGNTGRPADIIGDGVLQQDLDVWSFEGSAGQYLRIDVLGTGLPQPAFVLEGPNGYRRSSALLSTNDASREVVLPYDGSYELTVAPTAFLSSGLPVGSTSSGYVGVIEALAYPTPTTVVPSADIAVPTEVTGNLRDLSDNFLLLDAEVGDAVQLVFADASEAMPPAVIAFDASGALLTHVDLVLDEGSWVGTLVKEDPGTTVIVDWQSSTTANDAYSLEVSEVPHVQGGTLAPGSSGQSPTTVLPDFSTAAFSVTLSASSVLSWDVNGAIGPDLQIQSDDGTYFILHDEDASFFYGEPGTYTFFIFHDRDAATNDASLSYAAISPVDLGVLDPVLSPTGSSSGHLLAPDLVGPSEVWMIVETTTDSFVSIEPFMEAGDAEVVVYNTFGVPLRGLHRSLRHAVHAEAAAGRPLIVLLQHRDVTALDWSVTATAEPIPPFLEVEPNDASSNAVDLGTLPTASLGSIGNDEVDRFKISLDGPLLPSQTIEVHVENLSTSSTSYLDQAVSVVIYDELDQVVPHLERQGANAMRMYIPASATQDSSAFFIEILDFFVSSEQTYLVEARVVDTAMEIEPNDTVDNSDVAEALPASWYGFTGGTDPGDYFQVVLPSALTADQALRIRHENLQSGNSIDVYLETEGGIVLAHVRNTYPQLIVRGPVPAGTYRLRIVGPPQNAQPYRLNVEVLEDQPVEVEPNGDFATAFDFGELSRDDFKWAVGGSFIGDADWFKFTLPTVLDSDEGIQIRNLNLEDGGSLTVELFDFSSGTGQSLALFVSDTGIIRSSPTGTGPFGIRVITNEPGDDAADDNMDPYYLRVEYGPAGETGEPDSDLLSARFLGHVQSGDVEADIGMTHQSDDDWFTFTVDAALPAGEGIWVTYDTYYGGSADVRLYDASDPENLVLLSYDRGPLGQLMTRHADTTLYAVHIVGRSSALYDISVETGPDAELEPNDDAATATPVGALPASLFGVVSPHQTDVFRFTLASDLAAGEAVEVYFETDDEYTIRLRNAVAGTVIEEVVEEEGGTLRAENLTAGDYTITIDGNHYSGNSDIWVSDLYQLDVRVITTTP